MATQEETVENDPESIAARAFAALERWDIDAYEAALATDAVETRPQLNERFVGRANIVGMYRELPSPGPRVQWSSIGGGGGTFTAQGTIHYGEGWDHLVAVLRVEDGAVVHGDFYFASQLPAAPPYHARWSEPMPEPDPRPPG